MRIFAVIFLITAMAGCQQPEADQPPIANPPIENAAGCGGLMGLACEDGFYCSIPGGTCGAADQTGVCARKPDACTMEYDPVCGCDDRTYGNACGAAAAGVSVRSKGEC